MNSMKRQKDMTLEDEALKSFKLGFSSTKTKNFQMYKLGSEKAEEPEIKLPTLTMLKPLTVWTTTICGKFFKRWEYQTTLPVS